MPRQPRAFSASGMHHVMSRGVNKQTIFFEREDYEFFQLAMKEAFENSSAILLGYCLMPNHVHMLVFDIERSLSDVIRVINQRYAQRVNWKYGRTGHLFQDRFKSQTIDDEAYLISCLRYIHNNPSKAGICEAASYPWSSAHEYCGSPMIVDTSYLMPLLEGVGGYGQHSQECDDFEHIDIDGDCLSDEEATEMLLELIGGNDVRDLETLSISLRDCILRKAHQKGASARQLAALAKLSISSIYRIVNSQ